jgi:SSS family solute:Na+ symporter
VQLSFTKIGWVTIIGYIFNYFCTFLSGPEMVSRFESAKDEKTAQRAALLSGVLMAAMSLFPTILGLCALAVKDTLPNLTANGSNAMIEVASAYAPGFITGLVAAAIICATMSSADSNLLCMSTMVMNDLVFGNGFCKDMEDKKILFVTRTMNVVFAFCAMCISMLGIPIVTLNTFAFGIRCAGPFAAYGLGMMVEKCTKNAGILSIITGTIGFIFWQALSGGSFLFGILPVVFGCAIGTATFFIVNTIELKAGKPVAPSAFVEQ